MSSSGFNVIRKHARDATSVRIKELAQELARQRSEIAGSQLETDDVRSQGRMDHSTIKLNDERLKFATVIPASTDYFFEFQTEPDFDKLKVWFMMDHLGAKMRDISGFGNDAFIRGHPTLVRAPLNLGYQQTSAAFGTPAMLFNSGTDVVSKLEGEYVWIPDHPSIQFTEFAAGFTLCLRFRCLDFTSHQFSAIGTAVRRIVSKTDSALTGHDVTTATDGLNLVANRIGTSNGIEFQVVHNGINYQKRASGFNTSSWYQIICTYDPTLTANDRVKIYVGGTLTGSASTTNLFLPLHPNLRIGARDSNSGFFKGYIHDFRMYMGKILTQSEITNLNTNEVTIDNIPKGHSFIVQYALVSQVLKFARHRYQMDGKIKKQRTHRYAVIAKVTKSKTHKYGILHVVTRSRTHKFNILKKVIATKTHKWNQGGTIVTPRTHKWNILSKVTTTKTHKYTVGGLQTQYQRFTKNTTAGSNITQEVTFTATPQALIVWSEGSTSDATFTAGSHTYYGFSDGTNHACVSGVSRDGPATSDTFSGQKNDKVITLLDNATAGVVVAEATVSFSANKAIFNWTTNDNRAVYIHCMALWGINNAEVKTFTAGTTSTGNETYLLNKTSMVPTFINTITHAGTLGFDTNTGNSISIGAAVSTARQFNIGNVSEDAVSPTDCWTSYSTTNSIVQLDDDSGSQEMAGSLNSFSPGTISINWTDAPPVSTRAFSVLALDSPSIDVGIFTQPNNVSGNQTITTASNVDAVKGLMVFTNGQTSTATASMCRLTVGGASGSGSTAQGLIAAGEIDATNPADAVRQNKTGSITKTFTPAATSGSSTTQTEASVNSLGTDQFVLNWSTIDANTRKFHYIAFGTS